jgi:CheY-like chemotaxis protein
MLSPKPRVLLAEDEELVRTLLVRILNEAGVAVEEADNGLSGLQAAHRLDGALSLIITDLDMPVMDGLEFARILQRTDPRVPFLFITALDPALITDSGIKGEVLAKPFTPEKFLELVTGMIARVSGPGRRV